MTIKEFCEKYDVTKSDELIDSIMKADMYMPFEAKVTLSRQAIEATSGLDSALLFLLFIKIVIENYTTIELSDSWNKDFNDLDSRELIEKITDRISAHEYTRLCQVFDMVKTDFGQNLVGIVEELAKVKK